MSGSNSDDVYVDINEEIQALRNMFPTISRSEFYHVETGTIGAKLRYVPTASEHDVFDVLLEYPRTYPHDPPRMWVTNPDIDPDCGMVVEYDHRNDALTDYVDEEEWSRVMNGYHAAIMMKSWIASYCQWLEGTGTRPATLDDQLNELATLVAQYRDRQ